MSRRTNILARLRRLKAGAARLVVASFAVAYLSAGVAPCAMAARHDSTAVGGDDSVLRHESHAGHGPGHGHEQANHAEHAQHAHGAPSGNPMAHDPAPVPADEGGMLCSHCPAGTDRRAAVAHDEALSTCSALDDLANVASHAKDAAQPLVPLLAAVAVMLPPPLAPPRAPPPVRTASVPAVPLNVRHCVFLI